MYSDNVIIKVYQSGGVIGCKYVKMRSDRTLKKYAVDFAQYLYEKGFGRACVINIINPERYYLLIKCMASHENNDGRWVKDFS